MVSILSASLRFSCLRHLTLTIPTAHVYRMAFNACLIFIMNHENSSILIGPDVDCGLHML